MSDKIRIEDGRPAWLLRELARISRARRSVHGDIPADVETWWAQIVAVAADLGIETRREDWQAWPT